MTKKIDTNIYNKGYIYFNFRLKSAAILLTKFNSINLIIIIMQLL